MDFIGEFTLRVHETCLTSDHNIFMVAPTDRDAHNQIPFLFTCILQICS